MVKIKNKNKLVLGIYISLILAGITKTYVSEAKDVIHMPISNKNILIDAGHGEWDPGKVAKDGTLEKDINLQIAKKLQQYLEQSGSFTMTTRIDDLALSNKKREDLKQRRDLANLDETDLLISIHQNSFPKESVKGAQVFYYGTSEESKKLAMAVQNRLKDISDSNNREAKANNDYYLLKQTKIPSIIVECGFLSNPDDNEKLKNEEYQKQLAWAIYLGVLDYYNM